MENTKEQNLFINNIDNEVTILYNEFRSQLDAKFSDVKYGIAIETFMQLFICENVINSMMLLKDYNSQQCLESIQKQIDAAIQQGIDAAKRFKERQTH